MLPTLLGGRFGYFYFFCSGKWKGKSEAPRRGGGTVLIENPRGFSRRGRPRGREGLCGELESFGGGGG